MIRRPATSVDVARRAGVSQSAVSRAFSPGASISAAMRARVLEAAEALNYRPSRIPAIMLSGRSGIVGIVVGGLTNPFYALALEHLSVSLRDGGMQIMLVHVDDALTLDAALDHLAGYRVDAVITALAVGSRKTAQALRDLGIPVICFNSRVAGPGISTINSNNHACGVRAGEIMRARDVRRPVWLAGPPRNAASRARRQGFLEVFANHRGETGHVVELQGDDTYHGGLAALRAHLAAGNRPDGIFSSNDLMACGALDALRAHGVLSCPEDVIVIGYDAIPQGAWDAYRLTTFDQNIPAFVAAASALLPRLLAAPAEQRSRRLMIEATLICRASAGAIEPDAFP